MISLSALKSALKSYEDKNYRKCIKICEENQNLSDVAGDLLCLKGISLHSLGKIDQGYENIKKGLQISFRSGLGWHLYAIMLKSDKKYVEASKAFKSAIKLEPSNQGLQKELSLLLMHLGDKTSFLNLRLDILSASSTNFLNLSSAAYGLLLLREYLPFLLATKSIILLSENSNFFPSLPCLANSSSLRVIDRSTSVETISKHDINRSASGFVFKIQSMCNLNMIDDALALLKSDEASDQYDRSLRFLYIKVLGQKSFEDPTHFNTLISLLEDMFKPEKASEEGLIEKLLSIQAMDYLNLLAYLYLSKEDIELSRDLYLRSLDQIVSAGEDTFDFGNYCFRRTTINSCYAMQHVVPSLISSKIFGQLLEGYLYSSILSIYKDRSKQDDITRNLKRILPNFMQSTCNIRSIRCNFILICFFYVSGLYTLMRQYISSMYVEAVYLNNPDTLFNSYILYISENCCEILYELAPIIPYSVMEMNFSLFLQSASALKAKNPLVYANTRRLISLYIHSSYLKNNLLTNNDL